MPPGPTAHADLAYLLRVGTVWVTDAHGLRPWAKVEGALPNFSASWSDEAERFVVTPFLPQFYFVPRGFRGRRFVRRAFNRAHRRE